MPDPETVRYTAAAKRVRRRHGLRALLIVCGVLLLAAGAGVVLAAGAELLAAGAEDELLPPEELLPPQAVRLSTIARERAAARNFFMRYSSIS